MDKPSRPSRNWKRIIWILPPLLIGIAAIVLAPKMKSGPTKVDVAERAVKVRAMKVTAIDVVPRVTGFGKVLPGRSWEAVAEVAGQVVWVADALQNGRIIKAGTELVRIEDANPRLVLAQTEAQLRSADTRKKATRDALKIARKELAIVQRDYERSKALASQGMVAKSALEASERQLLSGQNQVQTLENNLAVNQAELEVLESQRKAAALDLKRTKIIAPFDVRITDVKTGMARYANKGQLLLTADGLAVAEVEAQFSVGILRPLIGALNGGSGAATSQAALGLKAVVRLRTASHSVQWEARVDRISGTINPQTQSLGVVVAVSNPLAQSQPGERPPLLRNTFVEVELRSPPLPAQLVVPLEAIHDGEVFVVNPENRLERRKVKVRFAQRGYAVIAEGLQPEERLVTSDLLTAVEDMLLDPQEDKKSKRRIFMDATGQEVQP